MTIEMKAELLGKTMLLGCIPQSILLRLATFTTITEASAGQIVSEVNQENANNFLLLSGKIVVESDGIPWTILQGGDPFGVYLAPVNQENNFRLKALLPSVIAIFSFPQTDEARESEIMLLQRMVRHFALMPEAANHSDTSGGESPLALIRRLQNTQDHLFSIYSHDLRSPVASMVSVLNLLKSEMDSGASSDDLESLVISLLELSDVHLKMMENLRLWSELRAGRKSINYEQTAISLLVKNVVDNVMEDFKAKSVKILIAPIENITIETNGNLIQSILIELLTNARKFSYPGSSVHLDVSVNGQEILFAIQDTGKGITASRSTQLLKTGKNFSEYGTSNEPGTGLGLLIAKEMAALIGGRIDFESETGKGSTFTLRLPAVCQD